jgi:hypothetical protein
MTTQEFIFDLRAVFVEGDRGVEIEKIIRKLK